jgi:Tfp pilus assembly protein PilW
MPPLPIPSTLRGEHGFTLVEMLVTLVTGIIVILATLSVLDISISESSRISERVDADQRARGAMEKILQELHSSCIAAGVTPVEKESSGTELRLISQTGSETYFPNVTEHRIKLSAGKLTDSSYVSTEEKTRGEWLFPETPTKTQTLVTGVAQSTEGEGEHAVTVPMFKYYKYEGGNLSSTALTASSLSATEANEVAAVAVRFTTSPSSERTTGGRTVDLSDTAVLRFDPASAAGSNTPCG